MQFHNGPIDGVVWRELKKFHDARGWLCELFRHDELRPDQYPVMAYISLTHPGVARGPHEHVHQADYFCFLGPGSFKVYVWDNRPHSPTYRAREARVVGADNPMMVIIPEGVVHAYKCVSEEAGVVFNCPNQLYKGTGRKDLVVDEIRHEADPNTPYHLD
jgi:dTDP-4-dehydrorhamnose 3,5-epimerase